MNASSFACPTPPQQHGMLLAMQIRNAMEDFHDPNFVRNLSYRISMIPDYWEIPGQDGNMQDRTNAA
uniref:hypothetical protein n=1 Tax=Microbacterium proteolyticum TaxID=1572644 RepID=UPI002417BC77|nr:hypothetical protein [Microbacterium proteolyticum]